MHKGPGILRIRAPKGAPVTNIRARNSFITWGPKDPNYSKLRPLILVKSLAYLGPLGAQLLIEVRDTLVYLGPKGAQF